MQYMDCIGNDISADTTIKFCAATFEKRGNGDPYLFKCVFHQKSLFSVHVAIHSLLAVSSVLTVTNQMHVYSSYFYLIA